MTFSNVFVFSRIYKLMISMLSVQNFVINKFVDNYPQCFGIKPPFQRSFVILFELRTVFDFKHLRNPLARQL